MSNREIFYSVAMQEALVSLFEQNPDYVYFGEDVGHMGGTLFKNGLFERFGPDRCCTLIPFDYDSVLQSVKETGRLIVASEAP